KSFCVDVRAEPFSGAVECDGAGWRQGARRVERSDHPVSTCQARFVQAVAEKQMEVGMLLHPAISEVEGVPETCTHYSPGGADIFPLCKKLDDPLAVFRQCAVSAGFQKGGDELQMRFLVLFHKAPLHHQNFL